MVRFWWVNQGFSYGWESELGILWAPYKNKDDQRQPHWDRMDQVETGDLIIHYADMQIRATSVALTRAIPAASTRGHNVWEKNGREVNVRMQELGVPMHLTGIPEALRKQWKAPGSPFNVKGGVNQGYLFELPAEAGIWIMNELGLSAEAGDDLSDLGSRDDADAVIVVGPDGETVVKLRAEHEQLKKHLFGRQTEGRCALCGKILPISLLVTSHIKRRAECNHSERMDKQVVMAACALGCDAVYERGYIQVSPSGLIESGPRVVDTEHLAVFVSELVGRKVSVFGPATAKYFAWHAKWHAKRAQRIQDLTSQRQQSLVSLRA